MMIQWDRLPVRDESRGGHCFSKGISRRLDVAIESEA